MINGYRSKWPLYRDIEWQDPGYRDQKTGTTCVRAELACGRYALRLARALRCDITADSYGTLMIDTNC